MGNSYVKAMLRSMFLDDLEIDMELTNNNNNNMINYELWKQYKLKIEDNTTILNILLIISIVIIGLYIVFNCIFAAIWSKDFNDDPKPVFLLVMCIPKAALFFLFMLLYMASLVFLEVVKRNIDEVENTNMTADDIETQLEGFTRIKNMNEETIPGLVYAYYICFFLAIICNILSMLRLLDITDNHNNYLYNIWFLLYILFLVVLFILHCVLLGKLSNLYV